MYTEGTHFIFPWIERPIIYDVRLRPQQISSATGTRDLQTVNITLRVLARPKPAKLPEVYRTLGLNYEQRVLPSIITETLKSVIAQYNASQLLTMREAVSAEVMRKLKLRALYFNIEMDDISIKDLTFGKEYTLAVESKQVAQQEVRNKQTKENEQQQGHAMQEGSNSGREKNNDNQCPSPNPNSHPIHCPLCLVATLALHCITRRWLFACLCPEKTDSLTLVAILFSLTLLLLFRGNKG